MTDSTNDHEDVPILNIEEFARYFRRFGYTSDIIRTRVELEENGLTIDSLIEAGSVDLSVDICELSQQAPTIEGYLKMAALALAGIEALSEIAALDDEEAEPMSEINWRKTLPSILPDFDWSSLSEVQAEAVAHTLDLMVTQTVVNPLEEKIIELERLLEEAENGDRSA